MISDTPETEITPEEAEFLFPGSFTSFFGNGVGWVFCVIDDKLYAHFMVWPAASDYVWSGKKWVACE